MSRSAASSAAGREWRLLADGPRADAAWCLVICGYFLAQVVWRRVLGGALTLDEAEALLQSRHLAWGYGAQPPLYSWLQWLAFQVVPDQLLALALVKNALLAALYLAVYRLLRTAHPARIAGPAALSLFLLPQISWESQRDLTHSVLVLAMAALTTLVFWTRTLAGQRGGWLLLGAVSGFGLLAKANFAVVPLALIIAAASLPELRERLSIRGLVVAILAAAAVVALPARWMLAHPDLAFGSVHKLGVDGGPGVGAAAAAIGTLVESLAGLVALPLVVLGAILVLGRKERASSGPAPQTLDRLLLRTVVVSIALIAVVALVSGATNVRDRWLTPAIYLLPACATVRVLGRVGEGGARALIRTTVFLAALVVLALGVHFRYGRPGHPSLTRAPVDEIAAALASRFPGAQCIVAEPAWLAGNLIYHGPDLPVVSSRVPGDPPDPADRVVAVWWDGDRSGEIADRLAAKWGVPLRLEAASPVSAAFPIQPPERLEIGAAEVTR